MSTWATLLREIGSSIVDGRHRVTIPALLCTLEGYVIRTVIRPQGAEARDIRIIARLKEKSPLRADQDLNATGIPWLSAITFLDLLFARSYFDQPAPSLLNRHWVLHGRSETDWTLAWAYGDLEQVA